MTYVAASQMTDADLRSEYLRVQDIVAEVVGSVHGVLQRSLADRWVEVADEFERRERGWKRARDIGKTLEDQRQRAQAAASLTGRVHFVLGNGAIVTKLAALEPAYICEPHGYHPAY